MRVEGHGGTGLNVLEFGGEGPGILLLHGLTGRAANWTATARWLSRHGRVVGYDARGHGHSDKPDGPYDRPAYVGDAVAACSTSPVTSSRPLTVGKPATSRIAFSGYIAVIWPPSSGSESTTATLMPRKPA